MMRGSDCYTRYSLVILDDVISFCESNHIDYVLSGGSCLGAMRHK